MRRLLMFFLLVSLGGTPQPPPFFPIGLYHVPEEKIAEAESLGFNTIVGGSCGELSYLEKLRRRDMKAVPLTQFATLETFMNRRRNDPAILAWYLMDEPDRLERPVADVETAYRILKEADPTRPAFLTIWHRRAYADYFRHTDILVVDPYPIRTKHPDRPSDFMAVVRAIREARRLARGRPVWAVLQSFSWKPEFPRMPTPEELRCMLFLALAAGVDGLCLFAYPDLAEPKGEELRTALPPMLAELKSVLGIRRDLEVKGSKVVGCLLGEDLHILLVNSSRRPATVEFMTPWDKETRSLTLAPLEVRIVYDRN